MEITQEQTEKIGVQMVIDFNSSPNPNIELTTFQSLTSQGLDKIQLIGALAIARELSADDKQALLAVAILSHKRR